LEKPGSAENQFIVVDAERAFKRAEKEEAPTEASY